MSALNNLDNPIFNALKKEFAEIVWKLYDSIKEDSIPVHISILHIPFNVEIKVSNFSSIIEKLVGPREFEIIKPENI